MGCGCNASRKSDAPSARNKNVRKQPKKRNKRGATECLPREEKQFVPSSSVHPFIRSLMASVFSLTFRHSISFFLFVYLCSSCEGKRFTCNVVLRHSLLYAVGGLKPTVTIVIVLSTVESEGKPVRTSGSQSLNQCSLPLSQDNMFSLCDEMFYLLFHWLIVCTRVRS